MLYQIGLLTFETGPFAVDRVRRRASADFAVKPVIGGLKPREPMGEGDDELVFSGIILPFKLGGLTALEVAHGMRRSQIAQPVIRGDGKGMDYHVIEAVEEDHREIMVNGVGFTVDYEIRTAKAPPPSEGDAGKLIGGLVSLMQVLTG